MAVQSPRVSDHDLQVVTLLFRELRLAKNLLDRANDERQRGAKLVTHVREELGLQPVELARLLVHLLELLHHRLELHAPLPCRAGAPGESHGPGYERREKHRRPDGRDGRDGAHGAVQPVRGMPDDVDVEEVREPTGDDERAEQQRHRLEWQVLTSVNEVSQRHRNHDVRETDGPVGDDLQPQQCRLPQVAVPVRHKRLRGEELSEELEHGSYSGYSARRPRPLSPSVSRLPGSRSRPEEGRCRTSHPVRPRS